MAPTISFAGTVTLGGTGSFYGSKIVFSISSGATLVNSGTMNFYSSSLVTTGGGTLQNSGTIAIVNPGATTQVPVLSDPITGSGTIALGTNARLELSSSVGTGQTVVMNDGTSGNETLQFDQLSTFGATISGFSSSDLIAVTNKPYTNATYTSTGANSGTLNLFSGQYTLASFTLTYNDFGGGQSNLQITTTGASAQSAGLPAGYQTGGAGSGIGAVYRFFDTVTAPTSSPRTRASGMWFWPRARISRRRRTATATSRRATRMRWRSIASSTSISARISSPPTRPSETPSSPPGRTSPTSRPARSTST